jgi:subtilase family serine protease
VTNPTQFSLAQNLSDALTVMTRENKCGALTVTYYICFEPTSFFTQTLSNLVSKAQANGQSIFVASGDYGVDMCQVGYPNVSELSANPLITSVGGTQSSPSYDQNGFTTGYLTETSWSELNDAVASGGGISAIFTKPAWQLG